MSAMQLHLVRCTWPARAEQPQRTGSRSSNTLRLVSRVAVVVTVSASLAGQTRTPERKVERHVITSVRDPRVRIEVPSSAQYVGADRWILYEIADCELHAFVDADAQRRVRRLYWLQFESYIPSRPELHHTYDSPRHRQIGGLDFYVDTWVTSKADTITNGSDLEHVLTLIRSKGYDVPPEMMSVRLVHLLDSQKRKELMIIYSEDLAATGFSSAQLKPAGSGRARWLAIETNLIARALENVKLTLDF